MSVLVVESDPTQAATIRHVVCNVVGAEITVVESIDHALRALDRATPDLVLLPALVSPADEAKLITFLRTHPHGAHVETLITPALAPREEGSKRARGWRGWRGDRVPAPTSGIDESNVFAERLVWSLQNAREKRELDDAQREPPGDPALQVLDEAVSLAPDDAASLALDDAVSLAPDEAVSLAPDDAVSLAPDYAVSLAPDDVVSLAPDDAVSVAPDGALGGQDDSVTRDTSSPDAVIAAVVHERAAPTEDNRRAHKRFLARELQALRAARLKSGSLVSLVDVSEGGALLESDTPLETESEAVLELITDLLQAHYVPFRVVRSQVAARGGKKRYIGACTFLSPLDISSLQGPGATESTPASEPDGLAALEAILRPYLLQPEDEAKLGRSSSRTTEAAPSGNPADRRRDVRVEGPFDGCRHGVIDVPVMIHNLSAGGCFVDSRLDAEPGQQLTLGVRPPGEDWLTVKAEVVHCQLGVGFAVRFVEVPGATRSGLERMVAARAGAVQPRTVRS